MCKGHIGSSKRGLYLDLSAVLSADADCAFLSTCGFFWPCGSSKCTFISHFTLCSCVGGRKTKIKIGRFGDSEQLAPCTQLRITLWSSALFFFFFSISPVFDNSQSDLVAMQFAKMVQSENDFYLNKKKKYFSSMLILLLWVLLQVIHSCIHSCIQLCWIVFLISTFVSTRCINFSVKFQWRKCSTRSWGCVVDVE